MPAHPGWVPDPITGFYKWVGPPSSPPPGSTPFGVDNGYQFMKTASKTKANSLGGTKTMGTKTKPVSSKLKPNKPSQIGSSGASTPSGSTTHFFVPQATINPAPTLAVTASAGIVIAATSAAIAAVAIPSTGVAAAIGSFITAGAVSSLTFPPLLIVVAVALVIWAILTLIDDLNKIKSDSQYSIQTRGNVYSNTGLRIYSAPFTGAVSSWGFPVTPQSVERGGVQELVITEKVFGNIAEQPGFIDVTEFWTISLSKGLAYSDDVSLNNARKYLEALLDAQAGGRGQKRYMTLHGTPELVTELNSVQPPPDNPPAPPAFLPVPNFNGNRDELTDDIRDIMEENLGIYYTWKDANPNWDYRGLYAAPADPSKLVWTYPDPQNISLYFFDTGQIVQVPTSFNTKDFQIDFVSQSDSSSWSTGILNKWFHYTFACKKTVPFTIQYGAGMFSNTLMQVLLTVQPYAQAPKIFADNFCAVGVGMSKVPSAYLVVVNPLPNLPAGTGNGKGVYALELTPPEPDTVALPLGILLRSPQALPAPSITFNSFTAYWTQVQHALDYLLDVSAVSDFSTTVYSGQAVSGTTFFVPNLTPNTTYYYRVRARAGTSVSGVSNVQPVTTAALTLDAPTATAPTTVQTDRFTANWTDVENAVDYLLDVSTTADFSAPVLTGQMVSGTNFLVPNLAANTRYYYRLRARNGAVLSAHSNVITLLTSSVVVPPVATLDAPIATAAAALTHQSFTANWLPVVNANDYLLDVALDAGFGTLVVAGRVVNGTMSAVTGLLPLTPYWYRVRARNGAVVSANSNVINPTTLDTPLPAPVANPAGGTVNFTASWSAVLTADDYVLEVSTSPSFGTFIVQGQTVNGTSQFVGGLTAGATYFYRVRARRGATFSDNSNTITVQLGLAAPTAPVATAATTVLSTSFTANWLDTPGAADYLLDVASDAGFGALVVNSRVVSALSSDITGLNINTQYWYRIRARNSAGTSGFSNVIGVQTGLMPQPDTPNITSFANVTATSFQVFYSLVSGGTGYDVQISTDPNFSTTLATTGAGAGINNVTFSGLATNTTYYVRVRATRALSSPSFSNFSGIANVRLGAAAGGTFPQHPLSGFPFGAPDQITINSFRLLWTPQQDVDILNAPVANTPVGQTYEIDVARDAAFTNFVANNQAVSGLNAFFSNVQNDLNFYYSRFYYRLRSRSQDGTKVSGNSPTYLVALPDPQASMQGVTLSTQGATTSSIDVRINNRDPRVYVGNVNSLLRDFYFLEVSTSPSFAQVFQLTQQAGNAVLVGGMTSPNNSLSDTAFLSNNDVLSIQGLQPATRYYFRTRAKFVLPPSPYAEAVTDVTLGVPNNPPTLLPATNIGQCRFQANWQTANVASYDVEVQKSPGGEFVRLENVAALLLVVNEPQVQPTNFQYRVRSVSAQGLRSGWSGLQPVVMQQFFDPVDIRPSLVTTNSFRVAWAAQMNATQYRVVIYRGGTLIVDTIIPQLSYDAIGLQADTVYTVQIFPRNQYGEQYMNPNLAPIIQVVQTLGALSVIPPAAPALAFVSSTTTSITLNLTGTVVGVDYTLDVALDAAFTNLVASGLYAEAGANVVAALQPDTLYFARARGYNGAYSPFSGTASGRTQLAAPHLLLPTEVESTSVRLTWQSQQSVTQSLLDVARDAAFTDFVVQNEVVIGGLTRIVTGLQPETTYWARVRTENPRGITPYSNVREIITDSDDEEVNVALF